MVDRNELFVTIRDDNGALLDPVTITCSTRSGPEYLPEKLSKGVYLVAKKATPVSGGCVAWKIQEKSGDPIKETFQASDGGVFHVNEMKVPTVFMRTTLFARCRCKHIIEVKILGFPGLKSFRVYGICPHCSKKTNRLAFKYENMEARPVPKSRHKDTKVARKTAANSRNDSKPLPLCECGRPLINKDVCSDRNCQQTSW